MACFEQAKKVDPNLDFFAFLCAQYYKTRFEAQIISEIGVGTYHSLYFFAKILFPKS